MGSGGARGEPDFLKIPTNSAIKTKNYLKFLLVLLKLKLILNSH